MLTEAEAKTKWCPMARVQPQGVGGNRYPMEHDAVGISPFAKCIGSACMMWRGRETEQFREAADAEFQKTGNRMKPFPNDCEGYCGLAGTP